MVVTCLHERAADRSRRTDSGSPRPGIDGVFAEAELPAENHSRIVVTFDPVPLNLSVPGSVAEGESLQVALQGAELLGIEEPGGGSIGVGMHRRKCSGGTLKKGLLDEYRSFGALGRTEFQPAYAVRARPDRRGRGFAHSGRPDRGVPVRGRTARRIEVYGLFVGGRSAAKTIPTGP